ncbi:MAG TPA: response regulator transcription factor [Caldilineaceae bacterium]|nr:response regulator transcription factor [Caldilineaceae bacterium]
MAPFRVVVADDSHSFRTTLTRFLNTLPHFTVVGEAADGDEALRLVDQLAPDLLLLDIRMPRMDGMEVLERLQAQGMPVQVVVLSAHSDPYYERQVLADGAAAFVAKGNVESLLSTLRDLFPPNPAP